MAESTRAQNAYREIGDLLERTGCGVSLWSGPRGQFCAPRVEDASPIEPIFTYPGRSIPGACLLYAYRKAGNKLASRRHGRRRRFQVAIMSTYNPAHGVREHIAAIPLPALLVLLKEAGRIPVERSEP